MLDLGKEVRLLCSCTIEVKTTATARYLKLGNVYDLGGNRACISQL